MVAHRLSTIARAERIVVLEDGRITESGTYRELVSLSFAYDLKPLLKSMNNLKVGRENSRFRTLMAAQLNAAAGESLYLGPKPTDLQDGKKDETSNTEHHPRTGLHAVDSSSLTTL